MGRSGRARYTPFSCGALGRRKRTSGGGRVVRPTLGDASIEGQLRIPFAREWDKAEREKSHCKLPRGGSVSGREDIAWDMCSVWVVAHSLRFAKAVL